VQQRVGVQGDDQLSPHRRQAGVEGVVLAGARLVDAADPLAGGGAVRHGHGSGAVGGRVVDHQDLDRPRIVLAGDVGDRLLDALRLVAGGDQHRDRDGRMRAVQRQMETPSQPAASSRATTNFAVTEAYRRRRTGPGAVPVPTAVLGCC
jgi:hypothetical protein